MENTDSQKSEGRPASVESSSKNDSFSETLQGIEKDRREYYRSFLEQNKDPENIIDKMIELEKESSFDSLTGAFNQRGFMMILQKNIMPRLKRENLSFLVVFADMDNLKNINDTQGHGEGNKAIIQMVERTKSCLRKGDFVVRWTRGDEFLVFMPWKPNEDPNSVINRLNSAYQGDENNQKIGVSIGYAQGRHSDKFLEVVEKADKVMYENKRQRKQNNGE